MDVITNCLVRTVTALLFLTVLSMLGQTAAYAAVTVTPLTWNVIGLDSNNVDMGPNEFPIGARVCNTGNGSTSVTEVRFVWDDGLGIYTGSVGASAFINLKDGTTDTLYSPSSPLSLTAGACSDAYFNVSVNRLTTSYHQSRAYHITARDSGGIAASPIPRQLYVENLVSQSRNTLTGLEYAPDVSGSPGAYTSVPPGGTMALSVGNTYWIKLAGATSTNGYEQIESFINLPNTVFQVQKVVTTYSAESSATLNPPYDTVYGDACLWDNDPNSPNYMHCIGTGKAGGSVTTSYQVRILSLPATPLSATVPLGMTIYDFSGSSFHYNSDFSANTRTAEIIDPTRLTFSKNFSPDPVIMGGVSSLTFTITNPFNVAITGVNFVDIFPTTPGVMTLANSTFKSTCGGTVQDSGGGSLTAGDGGIMLSNGTVTANGSCTITVSVTASATGTYSNTTGNLFVGTTDTGRSAAATLYVGDRTAAIPTCGIQLATWNFTSSLTPSFKSSLVTAATAGLEPASTLISTVPATINGRAGVWSVLSNSAGTKWLETGTTSAAPYLEFTVDTSNYTDVAIVFDADLEGGWGTANNNHVYVWSSADGGAFTPTPRLDLTNINAKTWEVGNTAHAAVTGAATTTFRINVAGAKQTGTMPSLNLDNVQILGCRVLTPPTIAKSFAPDPVAVGATSTLTITITNPNEGPTSTLTGIDFTDILPVSILPGTVTVTSGSATITGTDTHFLSTLYPGSVVGIPGSPVPLTGTVAVTNNGYYVTGTGTNFTGEVLPGSRVLIGTVSYVVTDVPGATTLVLANNYQGPTASGLTVSGYRRYIVAAIQSDTQLTLTANYAGATASGLTMAPGLTLATAPTTTCRGTVSGLVGTVGLALSGDRLKGLIAVTSGSATVTGTGTAFTSQLAPGSRIEINGVFYEVLAIASDTSLTLTRTYAGATAANLIYTYYTIPLQGTVNVTDSSFTVTGNGTAFTTQLVPNDIIYIKSVRYTVAGITSDTTLTLTTRYAGLGNNIAETGVLYDANYVLEGTVTTTTGSTAVTGSGTLFRTELYPGEVIYIGASQYTIAAITDNTHLTLTTAVTTGAAGLRISHEGRTGLVGGGAATCTVTAEVRASTPGVRTNITGTILSLESGANTTSSGFATANLSAVDPPVIAKHFSPNPIVAGTGNVSALTFTIVNPNQNDVLEGVAFTDTFPTAATSPADMTIVAGPLSVSTTVSFAATDKTITRTSGNFVDEGFTVGSTISTTSGTNPGPFTISSVSATTITVNETVQNQSASSVTINKYYLSGCGSPIFTPLPGAGSISFSGATIAAGGTCTVTVNVTAPAAGIHATVASIQSDTQLTLTTAASAVSGWSITHNGATPLSGTVAIQGDSLTIVRGTGTRFQTELAAGDIITIGAYRNTSGAVSAIINGLPVSNNTASDALTVNPAHPAIAIRKQAGTSADPNGAWYNTLAIAPGSLVYYKFTVENIGDVPLSSFTVTDPILVPASPHELTCSWSQTSLPVGTASVDPTATCVFGPITAVAGSHINTATAHGVYSGTTYDSAPDSATYTTTGLIITKSVAESFYAVAGNLLHYSYVVTNAGAASIQGPVTVTDTKATVTCPQMSTIGDGDNYFDPGESTTCTATYTVKETDIGEGNIVTNSAYATVATFNSNTATKSVPYSPADLTISNSHNPSGAVTLGNAFSWTLTMQSSSAATTPVTFATGQTIVSEPLPSTGATYGSVTPGNFTNMTGTGNITCSIATSTLTCVATGGPVTFNANSAGSFTASFLVTPTAAGTLSATATIDPGNVIYETNESNNTATDPVTVNKATPTVTTSIHDSGHDVVTFVQPDTTVHDSATVSGVSSITPTGNVTFTFYTTIDCTGTGTSAGTVALTSGVADPSASEGPLSAGSYSFKASYAGDSNYIAVDGSCEPLTVANFPTISKAFAASNLASGGSTILTVTVGNTNTGAITLTGDLTDTLPAGMTIYAAGSTTCAGTLAATVGSGSFTLANGASIPNGGCTITMPVTSSTPGAAINTIPIGALQTSAGSNTLAATATLNVYLPPTVTKAFAAASILSGGSTTLTLTLANPSANPGVLTTVQVDDPFPTGMTLKDIAFAFTPAACGTVTKPPPGGGASAAGDTAVLFTAASLEAGSSCQVVMNVTSSTAGPANNVTTPPTATGPVALSGAAARATLPVGSYADLAITKTADVMSPALNDTVHFTLTVVNYGPSDATGVAVTDLLPSGLNYAGDSTGGVSYTPNTGVWTIGSLAAGASATIAIVATAQQTGTIFNVATITAATEFDPDRSNNSSALLLNGGASQADLGVYKSVNNAAPHAGDTVVFTITVTNNGPGSASNVGLADLLPAGLTFQAAIPSQGTYTAGTGVWAVGNLIPGETATLELSAQVNPGAAGTIINTARITQSDRPDPDVTNNSSSTVLVLDGTSPTVADIAVQKTVNQAAVAQNATVVFTIVTRNNGPDSATNVFITDQLPAGTSYVAPYWTSQGSYDYVTGNWDVGNLATGATALLELKASVTAKATNKATSSLGAGLLDPYSGNNSASATVTDTGLFIVKKTNGTNNDFPRGIKLVIGSTVTWTYEVTNLGATELTNLTVTDDKITGAVCTIATLLPNTTSTCTATGIVQAGQYSNTGTVTNGAVTATNPDYYYGVEVCDVDGDGNIDRNDINLIFSAVDQIPYAGDPRKVTTAYPNLITINDARGCVLRCSKANCVP